MGKTNYSVGDKYGRLTIREIFKRPTGNKGRVIKYVKCKCDCGGESITTITHLRDGRTQSCGCYLMERLIKHKMCSTPEYYTWANMKDRCLNNKNKRWNRYGGRGITVCGRWLNFKNFYEDMGEKPAGKTLDRINNNDGYYKNNCKWSTPSEQQNNLISNVYIEFNGVKKTVSEWSDSLKIKRETINARLNRGWDVDEILRRGLGKRRKKYNFMDTNKTKSEWAKILGITTNTINLRKKRGLPINKILTSERWAK